MSEQFDLYAAKLEAAKRVHMRELNRQLFAVDALAPAYVPVRRRWHDRARGYLAGWCDAWTAIRRAAKGEPVFPEPEDY